MKKVLKITGKTLVVLIALVLIAYLVIYANMRSRINKKYSFAPETIAINRDSASIANGRHLVAIRGCIDCHGNNFEGKIMNDDAMLGTLSSTNLTRGKGGLPADYGVQDWMMALRHGVDRKGRPLLMMPLHETALLSRSDMSDIIAYVQQLPPADHQLPAIKPGPVLYIMGYLDKFTLLPVEKIDHAKQLDPSRPEPGSIAQGKYLSVTCQSCHRPSMKGGDPLAPGLPPVPDISATGAAGRISLPQFTTTLRTGKRPNGQQMNNDNMPWKMTAHYTDEEIQAIYKYLRSLKY